MAKLDARKRGTLRDSDFAYVDPSGRRRLPINDESHVRNALSRFNQVVFEDEAARDRARTRLLKAAARYGIVPIGFVTGQLRATSGRDLPTGAVTFLMTDIEGSTALLLQLGERYATLLAEARRMARAVIRRAGGREVDARADEYFAVFRSCGDAVGAALTLQARLAEHAWPDGVQVRVRMGIHSGRPTLTDAGYVGVAVHAVARVSAAARGGQVLLSRAALVLMGEGQPGTTVREVGPVPLKGLGTQVLYEVSSSSAPTGTR
jgi:class 3 adenylate cyclase